MLPTELKQKQVWIPAMLFVLGMLLVALLGFAGDRMDNARIKLETRITAEQVRIRIESCFDSRGQLIQALANYPWQNRQQVIDTWADRASGLLPLYSGVQALNYVDPDWVIRVIFPAETNAAALNASLRSNTNASVKGALSQAESSALMTRTDIVELLQSGKGFALYKQIRSADGQALGFVNGVFRVKALMESCLPEGRLRDHFEFVFFEGGAPFYQQPQAVAPLRSRYLVNLPIDVPGQSWQLSFAPLQSYLDATNSIVDEVWIGLGLLLTTLLTLATRSLLVKQKTVEDNEDNYRLLVEHQTDMLVKVNPQGEFQYISPSYCEVFGKTEQQLLGKQFLPLVHEDDRELTSRSIESLKFPPHSSYHEQRAMTKGGWRWLAWSNSAVLDEKGAIESIVAVGRDVTDVKRLEASIAHTQKMTAMGELAGGITHDFNNLLQVILGTIEFLLLERNHDEKTKESLQQVCKVVERAMILTQKLSTLSRQELVRFEVFDLNKFSLDLMVLLERTMPASVNLSLSPSEEPLWITADRVQLEQVLLNLCFNARDAMAYSGNVIIQTGSRTLDKKTLGYRPDVEPGEYALITVEDDGCGIEPEILTKIFDPFFTTKVSGTGTGLGLANCYSIVKQHKGMIMVDSIPGEGSCFSLYLPLTDAVAQVSADDPPLVEKKTSADDQFILVADDNPDLLKLTRRIMHTAGFETLGAANGLQAIELFKEYKNRICLVVLDLVMPDMGGLEVAEKIRHVSSDVKIRFVSGYVPDHMAESLKEPVLRKPYTMEMLLQAVHESLGG